MKKSRQPKRVVAVIPPTYKDVLRVVRKVDPKAPLSELKGVFILVASHLVGADVDAISALIRIPRHEVEERGNRLREAGIWKGGEMLVDYSKEGKDSGLVLLLDGAVADGFVERSIQDGQPHYRITKAGINRVEHLIYGEKS